MSGIARSALIRGPAIVTMTSTTLRTFYTSEDVMIDLSPVWNPIHTSMYGRVDQFLKDRVIKFNLRLWGAWENLDVLFPSYALAAQAGASIFGTSDVPWTILGRNGDKILLANAQITKLANLYLGVDADRFAADVEVTALIANNTAPDAANAYYTISTAQSYSDNVFAKTNYKRSRFTGAWGALAGFTAIIPKEGFQVSWDFDAKPLVADGYGTIDYTVGQDTFRGTCKAIPIQPTMAQIEAQCADQGVAPGALLSGISADLTLTAADASVIVLKNAGITKHGYVFGAEKLRVGEVTWETTRGFSAGAPAAVATVA